MDSFLVIDKGRNIEEKALILVENNEYKGFGFVAVAELDQPMEVLKSFVKPYANNKDVSTIIRGYLKRNKAERVVGI